MSRFRFLFLALLISIAQDTLARSADELLIVDCLLPGQIRKLGQRIIYLTVRQAIKTSAQDREIRGGEYVAYGRANYATALKVWLPLAEGSDPSVTRLEAGMSRGAKINWFKTMTRKRSRMVLTSGGLEPVLDAGGGNHSVFAKALLDVLKANSEILEGGTLSSRGGCTGCLCGWPASGRTSARVRAD